jgi:hypothetical protein
MAEPAHAFEVPVGDDGDLVVPAHELARRGVRPGDKVRIQPLRQTRRTSRLGAGARPLGFTQEHLDELRREMGEGLGEDLTR